MQKIIIASNHLASIGYPIPEGTVVRLNLAWVKSKEEAAAVLREITHPVYLDYPQGRSKPPVPTISMEDAIDLANLFAAKVRFFAVSNVESGLMVNNLKEVLHEDIQVVPKIETIPGVQFLDEIIKTSGVRYIMLDKEDLYTSVKADQREYNKLVCEARMVCNASGVTCLELQGVIFS